MKNPTPIVLFASIALSIAGCSDDQAAPPAAPVSATTFAITKVYDVANNNDASDIRVEVAPPAAAALAKLTEARLVIAKASAPLTVDAIAGLSDANSIAIPLSSDAKQVIKPPGGAKDADGDAIVNAVAYKIYVATVGAQEKKDLSAPSDLTLEDKPVLAGSYVGTWEDLGPPGPGKYPMSMRLDDAYTGSIFYTGHFVSYGKSADDGKVTLVANGGAISLTLDQHIGQYLGAGQFGPGGGCPAMETLTGAIEDEVHIVFDVFTWSDCDGKRDAKLSFTRQ